MGKCKEDMIGSDPLIQGLLRAKGKQVEIIAFGVLYCGILKKVDLDAGSVEVVDGEDSVTLEIERIRSFSILSE